MLSDQDRVRMMRCSRLICRPDVDLDDLEREVMCGPVDAAVPRMAVEIARRRLAEDDAERAKGGRNALHIAAGGGLYKINDGPWQKRPLRESMKIQSHDFDVITFDDPPLAVGDVVRLASGSLKMTIHEIIDGAAKLIFTDDVGTIRGSDKPIPLACLRRAEEGEKPC